MAFKASYDAENDVLYIEFSNKDVERTSALDDLRLVDYDANNQPVGIEFIAASEGLGLDHVPFADQIEAFLEQQGLHFPIFA